MPITFHCPPLRMQIPGLQMSLTMMKPRLYSLQSVRELFVDVMMNLPSSVSLDISSENTLRLEMEKLNVEKTHERPQDSSTLASEH